MLPYIAVPACDAREFVTKLLSTVSVNDPGAPYVGKIGGSYD
jgi:hypothetical protein